MGGPVRESKAREQEGRAAAIQSAARPAVSTTHPVLQMQSAVGNQATQRILGTSQAAAGTVQRQSAPSATASGKAGGRVILIDANVIGEINRGNAQAAQTLLELRNSAKVYISRQAFNELTSQPGKMIAGVGPDLPRTAAANRLLLQDLGIEIAPAGAMSDRIAVHDTNISKMKGNISAQDLAHVAQARAIGAELWSLDRAFVKQSAMVEKQLGVKIAPESLSTPLVGKKVGEDYRVARKLLSLDPVEITVGGVIKKTPPLPTPSGGRGGGRRGSSGAAPKGSTGTARSIAREAGRQAATDLKLLRAARLFTAAAHALQAVSALSSLDRFMGMAFSKLSGGGFILNEQIARADEVRTDAQDLASRYEGFSESIVESIPALWAASYDPLSAGQAGSHVAELLDQLTVLRRDLGERLDAIRETLRLVRLKRQAALEILNSPESRGMIAAVTFGTAELAEIFAVSEDLLQIQSALGSAVTSFEKVAKQLDVDIETLDAWSELLFRNCEEGGYCSSYELFLGYSRLRIYPGEE